MNFITTNKKKERTRTAQRTNIEKGLLSLWFLYVQCVQMLIFTNNFKTINREWFMYSSIFKWKTINYDTWKMIAIQHGGQMNVHNHKHSFHKNAKAMTKTLKWIQQQFFFMHSSNITNKKAQQPLKDQSKRIQFQGNQLFCHSDSIIWPFCFVFFRISYRQEKQSSMIVQCR